MLLYSGAGAGAGALYSRCPYRHRTGDNFLALVVMCYATYMFYLANPINLCYFTAGDHHGCPYRHWTDDNLRATLRSLRLNPRAIDTVMEKKQAHHYQLACASTFEGSHGCACDIGINHPNQYFEASREVSSRCC
jgi:hypothetical protein